MIESFKSKALRELFETGRSAKVPPALKQRASDMLETLDAATGLRDVNISGYDFHPLQNTSPQRYSIHINGPWCITFEWERDRAIRVDLEQYH